MKTIKNLTADELRKSILQLAIQGKLVKQNPNDEPASELVKKIYEEKKKLIAEGKIKKDKNESYIFKDDDNCYYEKIGKNEPVKLEDLPFDIPDNWTWIRLKSLANIYNGNSINEDEKKKKYTNVVGRDFIATKDVGFDRTIAYNNGVNIPYELDTFRIAPANKILMCIEGGSAGRKIAITDREVCFGNKLACFDSIIVDDFYLFNIFQSTEFTSIFKSSLTGIIGGVSINTLKEFIIPLPPLEEQQRIVDKINSFEPLLQEYEGYEKKLTELESTFADKLKKSILQYAIEGKLVKQDPNDEPASVLLERIKNEKEQLIKEGKIKRDKNESYIFQGDDKNYYEQIDYLLPIPSNWKYIKLSFVIDVARGGSPRPIQDYLTTKSDGYNWIKIGDTDVNSKYITSTKEKIKKEGLYKTRLVHPGDFLLTNSMSFGHPYILKIDGCIHDGWLVLSDTIGVYDKDFLYYLLSSPYIYKSFCSSVGGSVVKNLNSDKVSNTIIPLISMNEQIKIANKLEKIFMMI